MTPRSAADSEQAGDSQHRMPAEERAERWSRVVDAVDYFQAVIDDRRRQPGEDMISDMVHATGEDGQPALSDERIIVHAQEMISAGNDTTANLIGVTTMFLAADRSQLERVQRDPELVGQAVEEALRRHGSARGMFRWTTRDVTVSGVTIPANSNVYLAFQASGHDTAHFADPSRYDIDRPNAGEHLAFGRGRHFCLGAPLARLETTIAVQSLIERLPTVRVVPGQTLDYVPVITGAILARLDVEWDDVDR
jgi:cytochrome P450